MARARLNLDVLRAVCEFLLDSSDVLSFALVCSSLRPIATRRLLQMSPIRLINSDRVARFHSFLFADAPSRLGPLVRELSINAEQSNDSYLLVRILASCQRLTDISIYVIYSPFPPIVDAIASLQSLRSISIYCNFACPALLREVRAPLLILSIYFPPGIRTRAWSPSTLQELLPRLPSTLEELHFMESFVGQDLHAAGAVSPAPISIRDYTVPQRALTFRGLFRGKAAAQLPTTPLPCT